MPTFLNVTKKDLEFLKTMGYGSEKTKSPYESVRFSGPGMVILYTSGKAVVSGKEGVIEKVVQQLIKQGCEIVPALGFVKEQGWIIGSDECLKGDTFGGLVVAAVKADDTGRRTLQLIGVQDSKTISNEDIPLLAQRIKEKFRYRIESVEPSEYNHHTQTYLMNMLHKEAAKKLGEGVHVVDLYPGCSAGDVRETHGESKYLEVAAASIIARDEGLKQIAKLSKELGFTVPLGSTHVADALLLLKKSKKDPSKYVKMHFKNVKKVFGQ